MEVDMRSSLSSPLWPPWSPPSPYSPPSSSSPSSLSSASPARPTERAAKSRGIRASLNINMRYPSLEKAPYMLRFAVSAFPP